MTETVVAVMFPVAGRQLAKLQGLLGTGYRVDDYFRLSAEPDILLCPPVSPGAIARVKSEHPGARVIVVEAPGDGAGAVGRVLEAGAAVYTVGAPPQALASAIKELAGPGQLEGRATW